MNKSIFDPCLHFGHVVQAKTKDGETFEGELYCYDTNMKFVVIKGEGKNGTANFYIIKTDIIVDIEIRRRVKVLHYPLPQIERSLIEKIEKKALENFENIKARIGIGVTQEAQELFDFIWKTHPDCTWSNKDILVLNGEVRIKPPYGPDNCVAKNENLKNRFATVISKFRQKRNNMPSWA
ncbi:Uncharacterized protein PCOAH_00035570 [Plasmodium coatneyi]|uniref:AD domain-containing protein n=1 Tax=Plasmodium coatneyi TaxID=208452 RepID=A0A1B1E1F8_9APIC|nr:Uncharacterized protein PCOAH_00035570 [Plasmodium coatneyi]ANQ08876.1 Uncharacterized protein PCOAH_00035570 [Plasmodium coatneyi]